MATRGVRYDHPNNLIRREIHVNNVTGAASASMAKVRTFQAGKLKAVHSLVITAGTNAAAGVDIYSGTTSVGAITHGTDTAGTQHTSGVIDATLAANSYLEIKGKANSATMVNSYCVEYEVTPNAVQTV